MKKHIMKFLNFFGFVLGYAVNVLILVICVYTVYRLAVKSFSIGGNFVAEAQEEKPFKEISLTVEEGTTLGEMAQMLDEEEIISNPWLYQLETALKGGGKPYPGGVFTVNNQMGASELNRTLRTVIVRGVDQRITIREGWNVKEIGQYLESEGIVTAEDFIETCNSGIFRYDFLRDIPHRENRLEGYLFPDTYFVSENADSIEIIDKMLFRFEEQYDEECIRKASDRGLTMDEVITIASIIEKEINRPEERAKASSVIFNRLDQNIKLQMCSTVLYVLEKRKDRLLDEDLQVESPYNTYTNSGLPVGPIGNPGKACIEAALNPIESDLMYFVVKDEATGEHVFTNDYNEFLSAKALYNQKY